MDLRSRSLLNELNEAAAKAADYWSPKFGLIVVPQPECAQFLREHELPAASPAESSWRDAVDACVGDALLFDEAQRVAGDLLAVGVAMCFGAWTPSPFRFLSEWIRSRQAFAPSLPVSDFVAMRADSATRVECAPTGHPDAVPAPAPRVVVR